MEIKKMTKREMENSMVETIVTLKDTLISLKSRYSNSYNDDETYERIWHQLRLNLIAKKKSRKNLLWIIKEMDALDDYINGLRKQGYTEEEAYDTLK
jgi:hypothetical protein